MPSRDIRPSQLAGFAEASKLGIPYWLLIRWHNDGAYVWTCLEMSGNDWPRSLPYAGTAWAAMGSLRVCVEAIIE
ncbi:MAG: hypothetical protein DRH30_00600 [Deltaproteobacteria bacterium]|nr:MAG: hypothetical protein DRH30_00600 [Deltaproteobacteria bacterium]